ncbi:MAG: hypothetical protein JOZ96_13350 [Acidobacteria bacterium]|nr:hypothetical protein [Acidobacteriota bacterium]
MIYDFPETSSPIGQGDIFFGVPILDLTDEELPTVDDEGNAQALPWETFAATGKDVSAIITVRPTIAIVGTQECDALRAPNITLFEVRPFRDVERKSKDTSKPAKWVPIITQHARINQKWFYLPADERICFSDKMGADFLTPIRVPRLTLERLIAFRKGRLNEVAKQHFRERLAEFFRRYAYDEWYPLTREELSEYQKTHPDAEPFPWQCEDWISKYGGGDGGSDYVVDQDEAVAELKEVLFRIRTESESLTAKFTQHTTSLQKPDNDLDKVAALLASDMNNFSTQVGGVLPKFAETIERLERSHSAYVSSAGTDSNRDVEEISDLRKYLSEMLRLLKPAKETVIERRNFTLHVKDININEVLNNAANQQSQVLHGVISNMEELESFALKMFSL